MLDHRAGGVVDLVLRHEDEVVQQVPEDALRQLEADTVARPSAAVAIESSQTDRLCQERKAAGAASDWTPITAQPGLTAFATMQAPAAPLPPPIGTTIASRRGSCSTISSVCVPTPAYQERLVPRVDVAAALLHGEPLAVLPRLVVVASVLDDLRAEGTDRPDLGRVCVLGTQMVTWTPNWRPA